ncbi:hypothetical protein [Paenibacillus lautus]|uniref:hypothetical protein n=1 Tax=Paenibacillus lautus TaxID=1401 RepID=UPI000FD84477|nr:hypothetical protein [Paenibacillus lautus]
MKVAILAAFLFYRYKVLICCVSEVTDPRVITYGGVCETQIQFHVDSFFSMSDQQKKEVTFDLLRKGLDKVIPEKGWDSDSFEQAFSKVIEARYEKRVVLEKTNFKS